MMAVSAIKHDQPDLVVALFVLLSEVVGEHGDWTTTTTDPGSGVDDGLAGFTGAGGVAEIRRYGFTGPGTMEPDRVSEAVGALTPYFSNVYTSEW